MMSLEYPQHFHTFKTMDMPWAFPTITVIQYSEFFFYLLAGNNSQGDTVFHLVG